ncbi:hypothetical protein P4S72_17655 [Vibrio sp. PP-XX7]
MEETLESLESTQQQLVDREKLAVLGQLVAGLPMSSITRLPRFCVGQILCLSKFNGFSAAIRMFLPKMHRYNSISQ